ncbi:MAG: fumarylacetoacetate hydrolase family protein [Parvibaculaceae bacterium]|nr:fumarylacetoacetate hydrolase family protein [Parvibaculaceae bacterium]
MPNDTSQAKRGLAQLADTLYEARRTRNAIPPISSSWTGGFGVAEAYAVQEINTQRRIADGDVIVGRKIGLTSPAVQAQLGVDEPDFGMLWKTEQVSEGTPVAMANLIQPKIEAEIAFVLKKDITVSKPSIEDISGAIDYAVAAVEIVDSAIADWKITLADTVADNASGAKFLLGSDRRSLGEIDMHLGGMELVQNGKQVSVGVAAACLGHPLNAVQWLADKMVEVGRPLQAGEVILSGALGPMATAHAGDDFTIHVQGFAPLHLSFC